MKLRDDIDPARTWITSDSHFGHENIKSFCHRPSDIEQTMMEEWAREVPPVNSTLLHLGDLSYRGNAWFKNMVAPHLTGERKLLVRGNHDKQRYSFYRDSGFKLAQPFAILYDGTDRRDGKYTISFSHYPWNEQYDNMPEPPPYHVRIHGHIHNNGYSGDINESFVPFVRRQINVSCEQTKYRPVNLKALLDGYLYGRTQKPRQED